MIWLSQKSCDLLLSQFNSTEVLKPECVAESLGGLINTQITGPFPWVSDAEFIFLTSSQVVLTLLFLSQTLRTPALDAYYCPYMWLRKLRLREVLWPSQGPTASKYGTMSQPRFLWCWSWGSASLTQCFLLPVSSSPEKPTIFCLFFFFFNFLSMILPRELWDHLLPLISLNQSVS